MKAFVYRIIMYVGGYVAAMDGVDCICFTAGVGENSPTIRTMICNYLFYLGLQIDQKKNQTRGEEIEISTDYSRVKVLVIPTNEELMIARDTVAVLEGRL